VLVIAKLHRVSPHGGPVSITHACTSCNTGKSGTSGSNGINNGPPSPQGLKDLGWLSPEQERLVDSRLQLHAKQRQDVDARYKYLESSNTTAASAGQNDGVVGCAEPAEETRSVTEDSPHDDESGGDFFSDGLTATSSVAASAASAAARGSLSMLSGAMSLLSSTATTLQGGSSNISIGAGGGAATSEQETAGAAAGNSTNTSAGTGKRPARGIISSMAQTEASGAVEA
jgi:hypothetical protein